MLEAELQHQPRVIQVAAIQQHRRLHARLQGTEVRAAELPPLGHDGQCAGSIGGGKRIVAKRQTGAVGPQRSHPRHRHRIEGAHRGAALQQLVDEQQAGGFPQVVGVGLEGQPPDPEGQTPQVVTVAVPDALPQQALLLLVDFPYGSHDLQVHPCVLPHARQSLHVLGKAGSTPAATRVQEVRADARVRADAHAHLLDVRPQTFGQA